MLDNDKLTLYDDKSKSKPKKVIDMTKVKNVCFHYDESAPKQSKKLRVKGRDESRFDVYAEKRTFMLRTEEENVWDAEDWVGQLKESMTRYNPILKNK